MVHDGLPRQLHAVAAVRRRAVLGVHVRGVVVLAVAGQPQQVGHHHLRTVPGPRRFHRVADGLQTRRQIGPVGRMPGETVPHRPVQQIRAPVLQTRRRGISVLVIRHDHHYRQPLDARHVHPLVE